MMNLLALYDQHKQTLRKQGLEPPSPEVLQKSLLDLSDRIYQDYQAHHNLTSEQQNLLAQLFSELKKSFGFVTLWQLEVPAIPEPKQRQSLLAIAQGGVGLFLFATLWVQNQFFAAFLLLLLAALSFVRAWQQRNLKPHSPKLHFKSELLLSELAAIFQIFDELIAKPSNMSPFNSAPKLGLTHEASEWQFFQDLLEAAYSHDAAFALKKANQLKTLLQLGQIEIVNFSAETKGDFDMLPSLDAQLKTPKTLAPALKRHQRVLCRGKVMMPT